MKNKNIFNYLRNQNKNITNNKLFIQNVSYIFKNPNFMSFNKI